MSDIDKILTTFGAQLVFEPNNLDWVKLKTEEAKQALEQLIKKARINENKYWLDIYEGVIKDFIDVETVKENHQSRIATLKGKNV